MNIPLPLVQPRTLRAYTWHQSRYCDVTSHISLQKYTQVLNHYCRHSSSYICNELWVRSEEQLEQLIKRDCSSWRIALVKQFSSLNHRPLCHSNIAKRSFVTHRGVFPSGEVMSKSLDSCSVASCVVVAKMYWQCNQELRSGFTTTFKPVMNRCARASQFLGWAVRKGLLAQGRDWPAKLPNHPWQWLQRYQSHC